MPKWPDTRTPPTEGELDRLGFSRTRKCPVCGAGLYWSVAVVPTADRFICLNACHLGPEGAARFRASLRSLNAPKENPGDDA